jgi:hypothetical protein
MATAGTIAQVHSNGRIFYEVLACADWLCTSNSQLLVAKGAATAADGSNQAAAEASLSQQQAEAAVAKAEAAVAKGEPGAQEQLAQAETELEEVLGSVSWRVVSLSLVLYAGIGSPSGCRGRVC